VDVKLGPDGALYICDWYNPIIGHYQASFRHPDRDKVHGRIWRVTYKGRPLLTPPPILSNLNSSDDTARIVALAELMRSADRYPREQAKFTLFGGDTAAVTKGLRTWYQQLDPNAPDADFALVQALGVFEAHETPEPVLLKRVLAAKSPEARAYAAATLARWADRLSPSPQDIEAKVRGLYQSTNPPPSTRVTADSAFEPVEKLSDLAHDADPRVRVAAIVAAGNILRAESMVVVLSAAKQPRDRFIDTALVAATSVLKPLWEPLVASGKSGWPEDWLALLKTLDKPKAAPAPAKKVVQQVGAPVVPIYGRLRASPFVLGDIAGQVREKGNVENGKKVYHRAELACIVCHRIGDEGGKVGPALDAVGSAQPLEFIIGTVIEPQREVKEGFETVRITTKKGTEVIGVIVAGNDSELTLRDAGGMEHTVAQADIAKREFIGSLMPAGLTDNLSAEDLRDLFAYLAQLGKAK
jgi:putative heme-binding domain-containing protein